MKRMKVEGLQNEVQLETHPQPSSLYIKNNKGRNGCEVEGLLLVTSWIVILNESEERKEEREREIPSGPSLFEKGKDRRTGSLFSLFLFPPHYVQTLDRRDRKKENTRWSSRWKMGRALAIVWQLGPISSISFISLLLFSPSFFKEGRKREAQSRTAFPHQLEI